MCRRASRVASMPATRCRTPALGRLSRTRRRYTRDVDRGHAFRNAFAWLSLTAVLLLALLPSIGRLASSHETGPRTILMEMCTTGSETLIAMVDPFDLADTPRPEPIDHGDMPDCAYCPLLATALIAVLWLAWPLMQPATQHRALRVAVRARGWHPCGLGSRGPPLAA